MRRELLRNGALIAAAIISGWIGWSGNILLIPIACTFPWIWSSVSNRLTAALVSAGYFLAASRGLPEGLAAFYGADLLPGLLLWLAASTSFVAIHTMFCTALPRHRPFCYLLVAVLMAMPPFGITGWAHPVTAAGVLFPGWGWWGLAAMTASLMGLASRLRPAVAIALASVWLWSAASWTDRELPENWRGVDLELGASLGRETDLKRQHDLIATVLRESVDGTRFVILPESTLGFWTEAVERLWRRALSDSSLTVLAGATVIETAGYDNVIVALTKDGGRILYRERMPVPGSMWQPWLSLFGKSGGARADFFANPVVWIDNWGVAPLICYEQLIVWPVLQSMLHDPDIIIAIGNGWWTGESSIVAVQRAATFAWARLFDRPVVISFNI